MVSSNGVNGASSVSGDPSGLRRRIAESTAGGVERNIDVTVDGLALLREQLDQLLDNAGAGLGATVLGQRLDGPRNDRGEVARQPVRRLGIGEIAQLGRDSGGDQSCQPLVERARKERFVEPRFEFLFRHQARVLPRLSRTDGFPEGVP